MKSKVLDFVIRLKNASLAKRRKVFLPYSKINKAIGELLVNEGFLRDIKEEIKDNKKALLAELKHEKRESVLKDVKIISKPSLGVHIGAKNIAAIDRKEGIGISVVSTSFGVMTGREASKKGVGGELLFRVW